MATASKLLSPDVILKGVSCHEFYHPWTSSCVLAYLDMWVLGIKGSLQFFFLVYVIQLLMSKKKFEKENLKLQIKNYIRTILFGSAMSAHFVGFGCLFRNFFGKFYHYTIAFLPAFACGFSISVEESKKLALYSCSFLSLSTEYIARQLIRSGVLKLTTANLCVWNMVSSALVMYLLKNTRRKQLHKNTSYWFYTPSISEMPADDANSNHEKSSGCYHKKPCWKHSIQDASKYLGIGAALQILRVLLKEIINIFNKPVYVLKRLLKWKNFSFGMYLGSFVFLYNAVNCILNRIYEDDSDWHALIAGFFAGAAIVFYPNLSLFFMGTTTILQELGIRGVSLGILPSSPVSLLALYALLNGVLIHSRLVDKDICHPFVENMITTCSGGISNLATATYEKYREIYREKLN